jgi:hypothetical protein
MKRIRIRIGLRLLLLLVALSCVLVAYLRALLDLRREAIRADIFKLEHQQYLLSFDAKYNPQAVPGLQKVTLEIAAKRRQIGLAE